VIAKMMLNWFPHTPTPPLKERKRERNRREEKKGEKKNASSTAYFI